MARRSTIMALTMAFLAGTAVDAGAQDSAANGLLSAEGALMHARLSGRLVADVAWAWSSGLIARATLTDWTHAALDTATQSLALVRASGARPRAGSPYDVHRDILTARGDLARDLPAPPVVVEDDLRRLARDLSLLDGTVIEPRAPAWFGDAPVSGPSHWEPLVEEPPAPTWEPAD